MTEIRWDLIHDAVGTDDEPQVECDGRCLTGADIGLPEYEWYAIDAECSLHGSAAKERQWIDQQDALGSDCA